MGLTELYICLCILIGLIAIHDSCINKSHLYAIPLVKPDPIGVSHVFCVYSESIAVSFYLYLLIQLEMNPYKDVRQGKLFQKCTHL